MLPIILAAVFAVGVMGSPSGQATFGFKPCDAKTGCMHPAFK